MATTNANGSSGDDSSGQHGFNRVKVHSGPTYGNYLKLDKLLSSQVLLSEATGNAVPDEHLFIITHQAYELWFKQILYDLDHVMDIFKAETVDETKTLRIVSLLDRIVKILKVLVDQMLILETMSPLDFLEFRNLLVPASGFQSLQFRLIENKLGLKSSQRIDYNCQHYKEVFRCSYARRELTETEDGPTLLSLVQSWLERTPGLEPDEFDFWNKYKVSVNLYLEDQRSAIEGITDESHKENATAEYIKTVNAFDSILDAQIHENLLKRGDRRLSHKATQGALLLSFYREIPRFSQPYQIIVLLMDIDSLLTKWRYNHVMLVQRMLGNKQGTGGSSGYMYLRSTISDRYKVFLDLFNLSTWLLPKDYVPEMTNAICRSLSVSSFAAYKIGELCLNKEILKKMENEEKQQ